MATMSTATATNDAAPAGSPLLLPLISTRVAGAGRPGGYDVGDRLTGTTEAGSTRSYQRQPKIRLVVERQATTVPFSIGISPAKLIYEHYISVTDKAANSGPVETLNAPDKTAPAAPICLIVATDGLSVSGQAEAGATGHHP